MQKSELPRKRTTILKVIVDPLPEVSVDETEGDYIRGDESHYEACHDNKAQVEMPEVGLNTRHDEYVVSPWPFEAAGIMWRITPVMSPFVETPCKDENLSSKSIYEFD